MFDSNEMIRDCFPALEASEAPSLEHGDAWRLWLLSGLAPVTPEAATAEAGKFNELLAMLRNVLTNEDVWDMIFMAVKLFKKDSVMVPESSGDKTPEMNVAVMLQFVMIIIQIIQKLKK